MNDRQRLAVMTLLYEAFKCDPAETVDGRDCLLPDVQLELLVDAIDLALAYGPSQAMRQRVQRETNEVVERRLADDALAKGQH